MQVFKTRSTAHFLEPRCSGTTNSGNKRSAILLVDHGSKRTEANETLTELRELVSARLGAGEIVHYAHMELASPTILDGFTRCVADGAQHVVIVPFFLGPGKHVTIDIPALSASAAETFPGLTHEVRGHLGLHPLLVDVVLERAAATTNAPGQ